MPGLTSTLMMATQALIAQQGAINATANNIANMNTAGYTRKEVVLTEGAPISEGDLQFGTGVVLERFQSVRDKLLELRIQQQSQEKGYTDAKVPALQQVETLFTDSKGGIGPAISAFFTSLQTMSSSQGSTASRNGVITAAQNLATAFSDTNQRLNDIKSNLNLQVNQNLNTVNQLTEEIAALNIQVAQLKAGGTDPAELEDKQIQLTQQLSQLIDIDVVQSEDGDTLTTVGGLPLVVGGKSYALVGQGADPTQIYLQGKNITSSITTGRLGATLEVRDRFLPGLMTDIDNLAKDLAQSFNAAHTAGYVSGNDASGNPYADGTHGGNFFSATGAANFKVLITDPTAIAASTGPDHTVTGNLSNIANLIAARNPASGPSADADYSAIVFKVGNATAQAESEASISDLSLRQLQNQRDALSGVSINEETANLMRFQHAFQAAAKVVSAIDEMTKTILNLGA